MNMHEELHQNGFTKTWMLFESGNGVSVDLSLFSAPKENIRPIDAYVVTEAEGATTYSARRAAGAVYEVACGYQPDIGPVVAGFDFKADFPVTGESGGLAFAVALAKRLLNNDPGPVAATGIVESSHNGGPIKGVRGIEAKLKAAAMILPPGGWVFYPEENNDEISVKLRSQLMSKGLKLHPVSSVAQTMNILFAHRPVRKELPEKQVSPKKTVIIIFLFLSILFAVFMGIVLWKDKKMPAQPTFSDRSESIVRQPGIPADQPALEEKPQDIQEHATDQLREGPADMDGPLSVENDLGTEAPVAGSPEAEQYTGSVSVTVNIFGKTRLNAEISRVLTTKLKDFFALPHHHLGPVENVVISGQIVVLRLEENWIENSHTYRSNIRAALRDFIYEDNNRKVERQNIEVIVHASGMVEDMLPLAAQELMNKMLSSILSDENGD